MHMTLLFLQEVANLTDVEWQWLRFVVNFGERFDERELGEGLHTPKQGLHTR